MRLLFRVMRPADDGFPNLGRSASTLGIRAEGRDNRPDIRVVDGYVMPDRGGMSVTPDDWHGIYFVFLENALDNAEPDRIWCLDEESLSDDLIFRIDSRHPDTHGFIEPSRRMPLEEYEALLGATRLHWRLYSITETA